MHDEIAQLHCPLGSSPTHTHAWNLAIIEACRVIQRREYSDPSVIEAAKTEAYRQGVHDERIRQKEDMSMAATRPENVFSKDRNSYTFLPRLPTTPEEMIEFIGCHYNSMQFGDGDVEYTDKSRVRYDLTVHDLLSCFDWWDFTPGTPIPDIP